MPVMQGKGMKNLGKKITGALFTVYTHLHIFQ